MSEINVNDYFTEIIDEGRSTIGYSIIDYKINELVHKIYEQNKKIRKLEEIKNKIFYPIMPEEYNTNKLLNTDDSELTESGKLAKQILTIIERKTDATN